MFKKNLVALAVMATVSVPAFADVVISPAGTTAQPFTTTTLAAVTKQPVLSFSTAQEDITATFSTTGDVKKNGFITLEVTGDATFNAAEVRKWLTVDAAAPYQGLEVSAANVGKKFNVEGAGYPVNATGLVNFDGTPIVADGTGTAPVGTQYSNYAAITTDAPGDQAAKEALALAAKTANDAPINAVPVAAIAGVVPSTAVVVDDMFRTENVSGTGPTSVDVIAHSIDLDGKRLRLALVDRGTTVGAATEVLTQKSGVAFFAGSNVKFNLSKANQIFNIKSGNAASTVGLKIGALRNASYTADPKATSDLFKLGDLFKLALVNTNTKATALVSERFARLSTVAPFTVVDNNNVEGKFSLQNITTNQNIQLNKVNLTIAGDFAGLRQDTAGNLLKADGSVNGWKVVNGVASRVAGDIVLEGGVTAPVYDFFLSVAPTNTVGIQAQSFDVNATILGSAQDTFNDFTANLAKVVLIDRDGMKFDTITTGTTAANQIFVRDISKKLPATGGKIFVTITEYDAHGVNGRGEGTVIVERKELATTLPSGGAVTLNPTEVAKEVGAATTAGRQARFVFEVETNQGEVAVKKSNSEGVDIKNGTKGVETLVDFTL